MLPRKLAIISLISLSASTILFADVARSQTVNQDIEGSAVGPDTFVNGSNFTVNPTGTLNQRIKCEARNNVPNIDPRCDASNTAIYGSGSSTTPPKDYPPKDRPPGHDYPHTPDLNQTVHNGGSNTTVITPTNANSSSSSNSNSFSDSNANATVKNSGNSNADATIKNSGNSNADATVKNSGNSSNTNLNTSQGGNAQGGNATVGNVGSSSAANVGDQKNRQTVTTGATTVSPNVSPSTRVKVDGDQYNSIQFGSQAPGTGGEAFSFQFRSGCGTSVAYRQGFALKPKRIGGGGFGFALDVSSTDMDTIENRSGVQNKMDSAFAAAMNVVDNQQTFEQRLSNGAVSREEAENRAIANCAPGYSGVRNVNQETVEIHREYIERPRRTCTARGCN